MQDWPIGKSAYFCGFDLIRPRMLVFWSVLGVRLGRRLWSAADPCAETRCPSATPPVLLPISLTNLAEAATVIPGAFRERSGLDIIRIYGVYWVARKRARSRSNVHIEYLSSRTGAPRPSKSQIMFSDYAWILVATWWVLLDDSSYMTSPSSESPWHLKNRSRVHHLRQGIRSVDALEKARAI